MTDASASRIEVRLTSDERGAIAYLIVDNRRKLNTLDRALMIDFVRQVEALASRDNLRALVVTGAGDKAFIGGANISEMAALDPASDEP
jgi:enoyl-CoA hydratase/carnithine racemase